MQKQISATRAAIIGLLLLLTTSCGLRVDYSKFDPRCREWLGIDNHRHIQWDFIKTNPPIESYYEFFMCINIPYDHFSGNMEYFSANSKSFLAFIPAKLATPRDDKEILLISIIFNEMSKTHRDDIQNNPQLLSTWKSAIDNMRRKDGWPYSVSYRIYNTVTKQP